MIPRWVDEYVGIPFVSCGRDRAGCDCYGLIRLVLNEKFGKNLPVLLGEYEDALNHRGTAALIDRLSPLLAGDPVHDPEPGDVAVLRFEGWPSHLGIFIGDGRILHSDTASGGSVVQQLSHPLLRGKVEGYYRVR